MPVEVTHTATPPPAKSGGNVAKRTIQGKSLEKEYTDAAESGLHLLATGAVLIGWHADAAAIGMHADKIAPEIAKLASQNEKIAAGLTWVAESGPYAALIEVSIALGLQLAVNHGLIKHPERLASAGVVHPDVLTAEMRAKMAETAAAALKKQKEAEDRLRAAQMQVHQVLGSLQEDGDNTLAENGESDVAS